MENSQMTPTLISVIESCHEIRVEDYQRTYQWERKQIEELFTDLTDTDGTSEKHFFGTLILQQLGRPEEQHFAVVDGQQRLTTVFILVSAFRDALKRLPEHSIQPANPNERPVNVLGKAQDMLYSTRRFTDHRFISNRVLRDLMRDGVMNEPENQVPLPVRHKNTTLKFRKAVGIIREIVKRDLEKCQSDVDKLTRIYSLLETLFEKFLVLRISTSTPAESLEIFLTLNDRGQPLGPSDIVRGHVMKNLGHEESDRDQELIQQRILDEWETIAANVGDPESFMRHYLVATTDDKVQKKKVVSIVTAQMADADPHRRKAKTEKFWSDLIDASETYNKIIEPKMGGDTQYQIELMEGLLKSHRIALLGLFRSNFVQADQNEIVRLVWVLSYRWVMASMNAQKLEDFFQLQCTHIRNGFGADVVKAEIIQKIATINLNAREFFENEGDSSFASRALLHAVNRKIAVGANHIPLDSTLHLEHIAPNSGNQEWADDLGISDPSSDEYNTLVSEIGNLTLLDQKLNLAAQRKRFGDKKNDHYHVSTMDITRDLCALPEWKPELIKDRTKWLTEMFEILWSPGLPNTPVERFSDWQQNQ